MNPLIQSTYQIIRDDNVVQGVFLLCAMWFFTRRLLKSIRNMADRILQANIEQPGRPFTVQFSPDFPGDRAAFQADAYVRTGSAPEALFFHPEARRWKQTDMGLGIGHAFVDGSLVAYRAVRTDVTPELLARIVEACDHKEIPPDLLADLSDRDHDEVFCILEALGLVRQFNLALSKVPTGSATVGPSFNFGHATRSLDLGDT